MKDRLPQFHLSLLWNLVECINWSNLGLYSNILLSTAWSNDTTFEVPKHGRPSAGSSFAEDAPPPRRELARFLLNAPTVRCVAASRRASRTRRSWTTCCCRRVTTSGFCPRSKVHWGPHLTSVKTTTPLTSYLKDPDYPEHLEHHRHRYHHTAPHNHSSLLTPRRKGTLYKSTCVRKCERKVMWEAYT